MVKGKRGRPSEAGPSSQPFFPPPVIGESIPLPFGMGGMGGGGGQGNGRGNIPPGGQILPVAKLPVDFDGVPLDGSQYLGMVRREAGDTKLPGDAARRRDSKGKKRVPAAEANEESGELSYYDDMDEGEDEVWESDESDESDDSDRAYVAQPLAASALEMRQEAEAQGDARLRMPSREWREEFVRKFANMREAMSNAPIGPIANPNIGKLPPLNSRGGWFRFVHGYASPSVPMAQPGEAEDEGGNGEEASAGVQQMGRAKVTQGLRVPNASLLRRFDTDHILALLSHMPYWLPQPLTEASHGSTSETQQLPPSISSHHSLWLFSLLSVLDGRLTSDEISELRTLARSAIACVALRRSLSVPAQSGNVPEASLAGHEAADGCEEGEMGAWMVIAAAAGIWHQADLWDDARRDLRALAAQ